MAQGFQREHELFGRPESYFQQLPAALLKKRDRLASSLRAAGFKPIAPEGGYYLTADVSGVSELFCFFFFRSFRFITKKGCVLLFHLLET